jgi:SAM-dependent methyltransferase
MNDFGASLTNILGEVLWHSATRDESIELVSHYHKYEVLRHAGRFLPARGKAPARFPPVRFLEVAAYAHTTGYMLAQSHGWNATLSDISVETLALGARHARESGLDIGRVRRVATDFHDMPFADGAFDIVFICSALHHTLRWQVLLNEMLRVTAPGGLLILLNEPCRRDYCFYRFPVNRPAAFRPVETELDRLGILRTIAEPFVGSRPETLFGVVENQKMPLPEILQLLGSQGTVVDLTLNYQANMSSWDQSLLAARAVPQELANLRSTIEKGILDRVAEARQKFTATDAALGIGFPDPAEVKAMAEKAARGIEALPLPAAAPEGARSRSGVQALGSSALSMLRRIANLAYRAPLIGTLVTHFLAFAARWGHRVPGGDALISGILRRLWAGPAVSAGPYEIAVANVFGAAFAAVVRKAGEGPPEPRPDELRYAAGSRKGVIIGYPPPLARALELAYDLVPDIQIAPPDEIGRHFPVREWKVGGEGGVRDLALAVPTGSIGLRPVSVPGRLVVLLRLYGAPLDEPFRIHLLAGDQPIAGVDVHQPDSLLLRGELPAGGTTSVLNVAVRRLDHTPLEKIPTVRVLALRIVCLGGGQGPQ